MAEKKAVEFNDNQTKILSYLKANAGKRFTLAQISEAVGFDVKSGTIVKLMKFAGVTKGEPVEIERKTIAKVNTYGVDAD
jgi:hypothetical protein